MFLLTREKYYPTSISKLEDSNNLVILGRSGSGKTVLIKPYWESIILLRKCYYDGIDIHRADEEQQKAQKTLCHGFPILHCWILSLC
jgi:ABC-type transporter Mla maintaining outer membrane lipid asymmetry ATPase subunit MlaF